MNVAPVGTSKLSAPQGKTFFASGEQEVQDRYAPSGLRLGCPFNTY